MQTDPHEDYGRGYVPFLGVDVYLDSRPLIPRVETEYWVEKVLQEIPNEVPLTILDIFSGSGCIGLAILKHRPNAFVTFADVEQKHLGTIEKSIEKNSLNRKHTFLIESDVWSHVDGRYDIITANPPYVSKERQTLAPGVAETEPSRALFAEEDGYEYIRKILDGLPRTLANKGVCFIEHEPFHTEKITAQAQQAGFVATVNKDQYGVERYARITRKPVA